MTNVVALTLETAAAITVLKVQVVYTVPDSQRRGKNVFVEELGMSQKVKDEEEYWGNILRVQSGAPGDYSYPYQVRAYFSTKN